SWCLAPDKSPAQIGPVSATHPHRQTYQSRRRLSLGCTEQGVQLLGWHGPAEEVALISVAAVGGQKTPLPFSLHAFGNNRYPEGNPQTNDGAGDHRVDMVNQHIPP